MDKRLTPDPPIIFPASGRAKIGKPHFDAAAERAFAHYGLPLSDDPLRPHPTFSPTRSASSLSLEDKLVNALSILQSAAATAYESADQLDGAKRKLAMGTVHLIELAQSWLDSVINETSTMGAAG
ncbi:DUF6124 family protein [Pseudomonas sp. MWU13-2100]|uniref:DUF6124 family protein n=1 Tax=Pseudomonas sp. MWU13-2100 TaxID=2935075 RepID=UPI0020109399|nr:hypothetical protein [Pseudomonas sp. MWU13-2100]